MGARFDLSLVLRGGGPARGDEKTVMEGTFLVRPLHLGILDHRFDDGGPEVIDFELAGHAVEPLEGMAMEFEPGGNLLVEDEFDILVTATGENHHEGPGFAKDTGVGVNEFAGLGEIDLGLETGLGFDAGNRLGWQVGFEGFDEAIQGWEGMVVAMLAKPLENSGNLDGGVMGTPFQD